MTLRGLGAAALLTASLSQGALAQGRLCSNGAVDPGFATGLVTGAVSQSGVAAPAGERWSEVMNNTGNLTESNTVIGFGCQKIGTTTSNRCADDFSVPLGGWSVSSLVNFAYQTNYAGGTSPVVAGIVQIWGPCPDSTVPGDVGCSVIAGDTTTNRLSTSVSSSTRRISNSVAPPPGIAPGTTRLIWRNELTFSPAIVLSPGRYWFDFQVDTGTTGNFSPPLTVAGVRGLATNNGRQFISTTSTWQAVIDAGNPASAPDVRQDFPFEVYGLGDAQDGCRDTIFLDGFQ